MGVGLIVGVVAAVWAAVVGALLWFTHRLVKLNRSRRPRADIESMDQLWRELDSIGR
ncbi:hypothetical protein [Longimicrobium sp.]|uniref:hypothetical protein n=1 Tax=Longimicrobium sp. TaxID=2029185 RepID=UPI002ED91559